MNLSAGFFPYLAAKLNDRLARLRLGLSEIDLKDDADRSEDRFLSLFNWKHSIIRRGLAILLAGVLIWTISHYPGGLPLIPSLIAMGVVVLSVLSITLGQFIIPLLLNFLGAMIHLRSFGWTEGGLFIVYSFLVIVLLLLMTVPERGFRDLLKTLVQEKLPSALRALVIMGAIFSAGLILIPEKGAEKSSDDSTAIERKNLAKLRRRLERISAEGVLPPEVIHKKLNRIRKSLDSQGDTGDLRKSLAETESELQADLSLGEVPSGDIGTTRERMLADLVSRTSLGISPDIWERMKDLEKKLEELPADGRVPDDLVRSYRELKFGNGGYYREETEFDSGSSEAIPPKIEELTRAVQEKTATFEELKNNALEQKGSSDPGLQFKNSELKERLEKIETLSPEERELLQSLIKRQGAQAQSMKELAGSTREKARVEDLQGKIEKLNRELRPSMNAEEKAEIAKKILSNERELQSVKKELREEKIRNILRKEKSEKPSSVGEKLLEHLRKLMKLLLVATVVFVAIWFFAKLKKKGVRKLQGIDPEVRLELEEKLRNLRKRKLSPREEVIETYNVFHEGLGSILFDHETPPACVVFSTIEGVASELRVPVFALTETFSRTFYGEKEVKTDELRNFRKGASEVFRFFDIRT